MYLSQGKYTGGKITFALFFFGSLEMQLFPFQWQQEFHSTDLLRKSGLLPFKVCSFSFSLPFTTAGELVKNKGPSHKVFAPVYLHYSHLVQVEKFIKTREIVKYAWFPGGFGLPPNQLFMNTKVQRLAFPLCTYFICWVLYFWLVDLTTEAQIQRSTDSCFDMMIFHPSSLILKSVKTFFCLFTSLNHSLKNSQIL